MNSFTHYLSPKAISSLVLLLGLVVFGGCKKDDDSAVAPNFTGKAKRYQLASTLNSSVSGTVTFQEKNDNVTAIVIRLTGTKANESYPAHIHFNTAAEGGDIAIDLNPVDGNTGFSQTDVTTTSYADLLKFNGYVNVHKSATDLGTLLAQGDIGINELTTTTKTYTLDSLGDSGVKGTATFTKRVSGEALVTINLSKKTMGAVYPAHIHAGNAAVAGGGAIAIDLANVDGTTGIGATSIKKTKADAAITYDELMDFDGYINVHKSATELTNVVSQGDMGRNEITESKVYNLATQAVPGISGTATFGKRKSGNTLVTLALKGTMAGNMHPAHIHANSAAEGGAIVISLADVDGATGMSKTNVIKSDGASGAAVNYDSLMVFDGYINVHNSMGDLGTLLAQTDIGKNELTGNYKEYVLSTVTIPNASGIARFSERKSGATLVTLTVASSVSGSMPAHIHFNSAAEGGAIMIPLNDVNGATGVSRTSVEKRDGDTVITYTQLLDYNGYVNVHQSMENINALVVQGDIGSNELTGVSKTYAITQKEGSGIAGSANFAERKNGKTLVTLTLSGTVPGTMYPAHIHTAKDDKIAISLKDVNGTTGTSKTTVKMLDEETDPITYTQLLGFAGYISVQQNVQPEKAVSQGNIGANAL